MTPNNDAAWRDCARARAAIQRRFDRESPRVGPATADTDAAAREHLVVCAACREFSEGMTLVCEGLRSLPVIEFPDEALETVWSHTVHKGPVSSWRSGETTLRRAVPRVARWTTAAAAVFAVALGGWWWSGSEDEAATHEAAVSRWVSDPGALAHAAAETRLAIELTHDAFVRIERAAINEARVGGVTRVLLRVPMRWSQKRRTNEL